MTYIEKIHGIKREGTTFSSNTNGFSLSETILVEAVSPVTTLAEVVSELPVFGSPGTTTFNPYQLTFTLNQSPHPQVANYYLNGVSNARRSTEERGKVSTLTPTQPLPEKDRKDQGIHPICARMT